MSVGFEYEIGIIDIETSRLFGKLCDWVRVVEIEIEKKSFMESRFVNMDDECYAGIY